MTYVKIWAFWQYKIITFDKPGNLSKSKPEITKFWTARKVVLLTNEKIWAFDKRSNQSFWQTRKSELFILSFDIPSGTKSCSESFLSTEKICASNKRKKSQLSTMNKLFVRKVKLSTRTCNWIKKMKYFNLLIKFKGKNINVGAFDQLRSFEWAKKIKTSSFRLSEIDKNIRLSGNDKKKRIFDWVKIRELSGHESWMEKSLKNLTFNWVKKSKYLSFDWMKKTKNIELSVE